MGFSKILLRRTLVPHSNYGKCYLSISSNLQSQVTSSRSRSAAAAVPLGAEEKNSIYDETNTQNENDSINFTDFQKAFKVKKTSEILRALAVYKLCSYDFLVTRNKELIKLSQVLLGKRGFNFMMKNSFYGHFVAGETHEEIKGNLDIMKKYGVGAILDYAVEADVPKSDIVEQIEEEEEEHLRLDLADAAHRYQFQREFVDRRENVFSARTYFYEGEEKCDENMEVFLQCIDTTAETAENGFAAIKVTALGRPAVLLRLSQVLNQIEFFFNEIASTGNTLKKKDVALERFIEGLDKLGIDMSPAAAKKLFNIIDINKDGSIDIVEWNKFLTPQLQLSKVFQSKSSLGEEVIASLTNQEVQEVENMTQRILKIAERAQEKNVRVMVDAEQTYLQPAITRVTLEAMRRFNKEKPVVFNTYQCYLKNTKDSIEADIELSRREGFAFGAKLVRGAYMEQERERAETCGYADPIHDTIENTHDCYNAVVTRALEEVHLNNANIMIATHNENSVKHAINTMKSHGIKNDEQKVFFGQLLGMCDVISFALGNAGYSAFKYVPYGPVEEVIPYLSRRAMENRSLMKGVVKERDMLFSELKRRFKTRSLNHDPTAATV